MSDKEQSARNQARRKCARRPHLARIFVRLPVEAIQLQHAPAARRRTNPGGAAAQLGSRAAVPHRLDTAAGEHKRPHGQISVEARADAAISLRCYSHGEGNSVGSGVVYSPADAALVTEALKLPGPTCVGSNCTKVQFLKQFSYMSGM